MRQYGCSNDDDDDDDGDDDDYNDDDDNESKNNDDELQPAAWTQCDLPAKVGAGKSDDLPQVLPNTYHRLNLLGNLLRKSDKLS